MRYLAASLVLAGLLAGCVTQPASSRSVVAADSLASVPDSRGAPQRRTIGFDAISLSRSPCFGKCPVYSITVHADGRVNYNGDRWVSVTGKREGRARMQALAELATMLQHLMPLPLIADYRPGKPACGKPFTTDMPGATITIRRDGSKQVLHYYKGCPNAPDWLPELAAQIDRAAGSGRWVGGHRASEILK